MKIKIPLLLIALFQMLLLFGQDQISTDSTVFVTPQWKKGELHDVKFTITSISSAKGKEVKYTSTFDASFLVKAADSSGFIVEWTYTKCKLEAGDDNIENYILAGILNTKIVCKFSDAGRFKEIINADDARVAITRSIDNLISASAHDAYVNLQYVSARQIIGSSIGLKTVILKQIEVYHADFGYEYLLGAIKNKKQKITNMFGGDDFNAVEKVQLTKLDNINSVCVIETSKTVDNEIVKAQIVEYFKKLAAQQGKSLDADFEKGKYEYSERMTQQIEFKKSILQKGSFTRVMNKGIQNQTTIIDIETID